MYWAHAALPHPKSCFLRTWSRFVFTASAFVKLVEYTAYDWQYFTSITGKHVVLVGSKINLGSCSRAFQNASASYRLIPSGGGSASYLTGRKSSQYRPQTLSCTWTTPGSSAKLIRSAFSRICVPSALHNVCDKLVTLLEDDRREFAPKQQGVFLEDDQIGPRHMLRILRPQESFFLAHDECTWVVTATSEVTTTIEVSFNVPIMGYVAVWLSESASMYSLDNMAEVKEYWHIPVASLLAEAKVKLRRRTLQADQHNQRWAIKLAQEEQSAWLEDTCLHGLWSDAHF